MQIIYGISLAFLQILCYSVDGATITVGGSPSLSEGDSKPSVYIDICFDRNLYTGGHAIMTDYEIITLVIAILGLCGSLVGIIVKLIIELIKAKK